MSARLAAATLALLGGALAPRAAPAAVIGLVWSASGRAEHTLSIAPGKFGELCGHLEAGTVVRWRFTADAALDFNIHHHVGKQVVYSAQEAARSAGEGRLTVPGAQEYCWMWTHKAGAGQPASVRVVLER